MVPRLRESCVLAHLGAFTQPRDNSLAVPFRMNHESQQLSIFRNQPRTAVDESGAPLTDACLPALLTRRFSSDRNNDGFEIEIDIDLPYLIYSYYTYRDGLQGGP